MNDVFADKSGRILAGAFARNIAQKLDGELISNALLARDELLGSLIDPRRDIDSECHYPATNTISAETYKQLYDRDPIACKVVQCIAKESWQVQPKVYEVEDPETQTPFEQAWDALQPTAGGTSWYKPEAGGSIWEYLLRADILSGIGHFGVLLMGFDDGKNLQDPVEGALTTNAFGKKHSITDCYLTSKEEENLRNLPDLSEQEIFTLNSLAQQREVTINSMQSAKVKPGQNPIFGQIDEYAPSTPEGVEGTDRQYSQMFGLQGESRYEPTGEGTDQQYYGVQFGPSEQASTKPSTKKLSLLFLRPFDESLVQIVRYEWNINNPRFGMPVMYRITLNDPREQHSGIGLPMATVFVHWSRVIHFADNLNSSEIFGSPRMQSVLNRLLDLQKIYGASAEGYWQAAFTGLSLETHPQLGGDVEIDSASVKDQLENYMNSLQRYLALTGMSAHTLAPTVSDPTSQIQVHLEAICIQLNIPVRVFKGSERGELASSQDDASWNDRLKARQNGYITPRIIVPFVDRLISVGVLPVPNYVEPVEDVIEDDTGVGAEFDQLIAEEMGEAGYENLEDEYDTLISEELKDRSPSAIFNSSGEQIGVVAPMGYTVLWPDLDSNTEKDKAQIAATLTQAIAGYVSGNIEAIMPLTNFYSKILGFSDEEAIELVKAAEQQQLEMEQDQLEQQGIMGDTQIDQFGGMQLPVEEDQYSQEQLYPEYDEEGNPIEEHPQEGKTPNPFEVQNAEFKEEDHPRAADGKFGSGSGSASKDTTSVKYDTKSNN